MKTRIKYLTIIYLSFILFVGTITGAVDRDREDPFPEKRGTDPVVIKDDDDARQKAAFQSLQLFKELVKQLPQPVLHQLGIKSQDRINKINNPSLGRPLDIYLVALDLLKVFRADIDPAKVLRDVNEVFYPVYIDGKPVSSITIRKRNGQWGFAVVGDKKALFKTMTRLKKDSPRSYFLVQIQALHLTFLAYLSEESELYFIPSHEHPNLALGLCEPVPAKEIFLNLKHYLSGEGTEDIVETAQVETFKDTWKDTAKTGKIMENGMKTQVLKGGISFTK